MRDIGDFFDKILKLNFGLKILECEYLYKIWIFYMNIYVKYLYLDFYIQLCMELK